MSQSVDDLYISLTIKEGGKLDKLRKQLKAIVGDKGEKKFKIDLGDSTKNIENNIREILKRIYFLMPTRIPGKARPFAMRETARIAKLNIGRDIRLYAEKLIPKSENDLRRIMSEFKVTTREELIDAFVDKIKDWQYILEQIISGVWVDDKAQRFLARINTLISNVELPIGKAYTIMTDIQSSVSEFNKLLADLLKKIGISALPEVNVSRILKEKFDALIVGDQDIQRNVEELIEAFGITDEKVKKYVLKSDTFYRKGTQEALDLFAKDFGYDIGELSKITSKEVMKSQELRALALILLKTMTYYKKGQTTGFPSGLGKVMYESLKTKFITPEVISAGGEVFDRLLNTFKEIYGKNPSDFFERGRIDFLLTNIQEEQEAIRKLFGEDILNSMKDMNSSFFELKNILSETNRAQFRFYQDMVGRRLFGVAAIVKDSIKNVFPDLQTKELNIMSEAIKAEVIDKLTALEEEKVKEEAIKEAGAESIEANILKAVGDVNDEIKKDIKDLSKKIDNLETESEPTIPGDM